MYMTFFTVWLDPDCWDEHFLFYNLSRNINSLKEFFKYFWAPYLLNLKIWYVLENKSMQVGFFHIFYYNVFERVSGHNGHIQLEVKDLPSWTLNFLIT